MLWQSSVSRLHLVFLFHLLPFVTSPKISILAFEFSNYDSKDAYVHITVQQF